jgi:metallophosphoesterase (TIGR00282 family)
MVIGRVYVPTMPASDPFEAIDRILETEKSRAKVFVVEVHAEATGEKVALGHYLDGKASLVFGTHTHIPTADARLLPGGTAYISDVGMTGPYDSVLGRRKEAVVKSMVTSMHVPYDVATGDVRLCGVMVEVDETTGRAISVERVEVPYVHAGPAYDADDQGR